MYPQDKFIEVELLDQKVCTFVILLKIARLPSVDLVPVYLQISSERKLVSHTLISTISCQTF